jgi:hypothetical protein
METSKKWYQSSICIVALLIFFFPVGLFLMWKYAEWKKVVKVIITLIFIVFLMSSASSTNPKNTQSTRSGEPTKQKEIATIQPTIQVVKPMTISDKVWKALDDGIKTRKGYVVDYDSSSKIASISLTQEIFYSETSMVKDSFITLVKFGKEVFKIDDVDAVRVVIKSDFTDQFGKKSTEDAVRIVMRKSEFGKYQWDNLRYTSVYTQFKNSAEELYIHPAIFKKVELDKLYLLL